MFLYIGMLLVLCFHKEQKRLEILHRVRGRITHSPLPRREFSLLCPSRLQGAHDLLLWRTKSFSSYVFDGECLTVDITVAPSKVLTCVLYY